MEYRLLCEEALLKLLKSGDESAFKEIYNRYGKQLYRTAYYKTRKHEVSEEIIQNVFVKLWEKRTASSILHLENYLIVAVKYNVINYFKSELAKQKNLSYIKEQYTEAEDTAVSNLLLHELSSLIDKAVRELPAKTRFIFNLSRNENYSIKEISESMHLSEKAVEYHITKSLKHLRFYLKEIVSFLIAFISIFFLFKG